MSDWALVDEFPEEGRLVWVYDPGALNNTIKAARWDEHGGWLHVPVEIGLDGFMTNASITSLVETVDVHQDRVVLHYVSHWHQARVGLPRPDAPALGE